MSNKKILIDHYVDDLRCPIYKTIMLDPVIASDGRLYEREAIEFWLANNKISPVTGDKIDTQILPAIIYKNIINSAIESYPELKDEQHIMGLKSHSMYTKEVDKIMMNYEYDLLLNYNEFNMKKLFHNEMEKHLQKINDKIMFHIIDNTKFSCDLNKQITCMMLHCNLQIIQHLISKQLKISSDRFLKMCTKFYSFIKRFKK